MNQKLYNSLTGIVFLVVAIIHLLRLVKGWPMTVNAFSVPVMVSWVGLIIAGFLSYQGLRKR